MPMGRKHHITIEIASSRNNTCVFIAGHPQYVMDEMFDICIVILRVAFILSQCCYIKALGI